MQEKNNYCKTHNSKLNPKSKRQSFSSFLLQKDTNSYISTPLLIAFSYTITCHFYRFFSFLFGQPHCSLLIGLFFASLYKIHDSS